MKALFLAFLLAALALPAWAGDTIYIPDPGKASSVDFDNDGTKEISAIDCNATTGAVQLDVDTDDKTITRASGSFLDDGFKVGCWVHLGALATPLGNRNNNHEFRITAVTATVLTVADPTDDISSDETGGGDEEAHAPPKIIIDVDEDGVPEAVFGFIESSSHVPTNSKSPYYVLKLIPKRTLTAGSEQNAALFIDLDVQSGSLNNGVTIGADVGGRLLQTTDSSSAVVEGILYRPEVVSNGNAIDTPASRAIVDEHTVRATAGTVTALGDVLSFWAQPKIRADGTSTATLAQISQFDAAPGVIAETGATLTITDRRAFFAEDVVTALCLGTCTVTDNVGLEIADLDAGTNNFGIRSAVTPAANSWFLYDSGGADSSMAGQLRIGDNTAPTNDLEVVGTAQLDGKLIIPNGTDPAATCTVGEIFMDTDTSSDTNCTTTFNGALCRCAATDTWTGE